MPEKRSYLFYAFMHTFILVNCHGELLQPVTVLTNLQRGNIQTQTNQAEPDDITLHNRAAMGELSAQDLRGMGLPVKFNVKCSSESDLGDKW